MELSSYIYQDSQLVSREAKEEVPCDGLSMSVCEYFTRTNVKLKVPKLTSHKK